MPGEQASELQRRAEALQGVAEVQCTPSTGSLLILFDPGAVDPASLAQALGLGVVSALPGRSAAEVSGSARQVRLGSPVVMAGSLGLSLLGLVAGRMGLHFGAGLVFLGGVADHVWVASRRRRARTQQA